ncbi:MAG: HAD family phosphatase [Acidobacteriota bacterium]|nr:HAD family phosphatase [Acidobacteriota bacterium]
MHKAILFDLGRVLVHFDFQIGYRALEKICPYPADQIPSRLAPTGLIERFESGQVTPEDFFQQFCAILDLDLPYPRFREIWSSIFTHAILPESLLEGLARRYRLVLLSNTNALHFQMIRQWYPHILRHFHALVLSYEVGAMKPQAEIYEAALRAADCPAAQCFYTDDIEAYVAAARARGIDAVVFSGQQQIERELRARAIAWD